MATLVILRVPKGKQNRQYGQSQHSDTAQYYPQYSHHFGLNIQLAASSMRGENFLGFVLPCSL
jgi:hypothetical protein